MPKTVLITGASRGIGRSIAAAFAKEGYQLVITCSKSEDELLSLKRDLERQFHTKILTSIGDVGSYSYIDHLFSQIETHFGGVDILINNAGISHIGLLSDMSIEDWERMVKVNLTSVFASCKLAIPYMLRKKQGKIINISSVWGIAGASCEAAYSACKGGVNALTKALAKELAPSGIQVNAIACGAIDTEMNACFSKEERQMIEEEIPAGRFGRPGEVAALALQLAGGSGYLTGQIIAIDGGWL